MIEPISFENIIKKLAKFLDTYSGIDPDRILNADSIRGTDLSEMIGESQAYSPNASKTFMLFELIENQEEDNYVTKGKTSTEMETIQTYNFHLKIYGNNSPTDAQRIASCFKQENNALDLRENGIFIRGVSKIEPINEFINDTLILRRDLIIKLESRHVFQNIGEDVGYFNENENIEVIVKNLSTIN